MKFTIYSADCLGNASNCFYPHKHVISNIDQLLPAMAKDQVFARYTDNYRSISRFLESDVIPQDCDNDHSDDPNDWITVEALSEMLRDVDHVIIPSRHHMLQKEGRSARPRMHILFPVRNYADAEEYNRIKKAIQTKYPFFDKQALNAARFFFGSNVSKENIIWHEGFLQIDETLDEQDFLENKEVSLPVYAGDSIPEGSRNNTMSHFAGRVLKRFGISDTAHTSYLERAAKCDPPLPKDELEAIWTSAVKFARKIQSQADYVPPEEYNSDFGNNSLKPDDYSDIGEAKVLSLNEGTNLRYTSATDYITFCGDCWREDKQKALGAVEGFLDKQLLDAETLVTAAENDLLSAGINEVVIKSRGKELFKAISSEQLSLYYQLIEADNYRKFVMKYRNYKNISNTMDTAKPMLAIDVSELDYDPELLNTPEATYDLTRGLNGARPHDPDDLITKVTACSPGDKGKQLWEDTLNVFFCNDTELITYVKQIVGMAAVGRVYAEQMIIAYGGGANGKSTFWNTIARVLGNYSGKISAEALTMGCKRNVKPEMAELKGRRLIIASELEEGTRLNTGMVKQLCSVDPIEAEKKYKDPFHFDPSHTLVLYTNHLPKVSANDEGTWRRLIVIPFNAKISGTSDKKNFGDYLFENAGPAILKWIIEGAETAIRKEFKINEPNAVQLAVDKYREDNDWLGQFIQEHCEVDPAFHEKSGELYQQYRSICIRGCEYIRSTSDFYGSLEKAGFTKRRTQNGVIIAGLRLKEGQDFLN